jgi:hypothetical protein
MAIDRDATLPEVQATLGQGNIMTTSSYLQARPESSERGSDLIKVDAGRISVLAGCVAGNAASQRGVWPRTAVKSVV